MGQNLFTGKDVGVLLPSGESGARAQQNFSSMLIEVEKLKADVYQKNEAEFLKNSKIDPVFVLSDKAREVQTKMLDNFNTTYGKLMQERGGNLTVDDKLQMQRAKDVVIMTQQQMQSDLQRYMQDRETIQKNPLKYSAEENKPFEDTYLNQGTYEPHELPVNPTAIITKYPNYKLKTENKETLTRPDPNNPNNEIHEVTSASKADVTEFIGADAIKDPAVMKDVFRHWGSLSPEQQKTYLDADKNGTVSDEEKQAMSLKASNNPIIQAYSDKYWKNFVDKDLKTVRKTSGTGKGFEFNFGGQKVSASPGVKRKDPVPYGDQVYTDSYRFDKPIPIGNVPTEGGIKYTRNSSRPLGKGNVQGVIKDYIADGDLVTIEVKKAYGAANVESGEFIAVPASSIPDVDSLPIIGDDSKPTTVGAMRGKSQPTKRGLLDNL